MESQERICGHLQLEREAVLTINISKALAVPGMGLPEVELRFLAEQAGKHYAIAEIGSWMGRSTRALADNTPGTVVAVDTWAGTPGDAHMQTLAGKPADWVFGEFMRNTADLANLTACHMHSLDAAVYFADRRFDIIFIDADHSYEAVKADILAWRELLAPGGLLCGHDFGPGQKPGVNQAVGELYPNAYIGAGSIWVAA